jgi:hypothetical protein
VADSGDVDGPGVADAGDGDGLGVADADGEAEGEAEAERLGCGVWDGLGDRVGMGADGVRLGVEAGPDTG